MPSNKPKKTKIRDVKDNATVNVGRRTDLVFDVSSGDAAGGQKTKFFVRAFHKLDGIPFAENLVENTETNGPQQDVPVQFKPVQRSTHVFTVLAWDSKSSQNQLPASVDDVRKDKIRLKVR